MVPNLTRGARPYALIENVVTDAAFRRCGIATFLMQELLARCWARGCYKAMLLSGSSRDEAHGLYLAVGFDASAKLGFVAKPSASQR